VLQVDPPEWADDGYLACGPAAHMPPSESQDRRRCGCCSVLSVSLCLSRRLPPYRARPGRSGRGSASYDSGVRLANALPRLPWSPRAWARRCAANHRLGQGDSGPYSALSPVALRRAGLDCGGVHVVRR
jgi:hypothetical protein